MRGLSNSPLFSFFKRGLSNRGGYPIGGLSARFYGIRNLSDLYDCENLLNSPFLLTVGVDPLLL